MAEAENIYDHEKAFEEARAVSEEEGKKASVTDMLCSTATQIALDNNVDLFICLTSTAGTQYPSCLRTTQEQGSCS